MCVGAVTAFAPAPVSHQSKSSSVSCIEWESIVEGVCVMREAQLQDAVVRLGVYSVVGGYNSYDRYQEHKI